MVVTRLLLAVKRYSLEIYLPGAPGSDVACSVESDEPFPPIHKGDLLNPRAWSTHYFQNLISFVNNGHNPNGVLLRVTGIEHFIFEKDGELSLYKLGIFTEAVDDSAEERIPGSL